MVLTYCCKIDWSIRCLHSCFGAILYFTIFFFQNQSLLTFHTISIPISGNVCATQFSVVWVVAVLVATGPWSLYNSHLHTTEHNMTLRVSYSATQHNHLLLFWATIFLLQFQRKLGILEIWLFFNFNSKIQQNFSTLGYCKSYYLGGSEAESKFQVS